MTNIYPQVASNIIKEQAHIIGPLAWSEARKVKGLQVSQNNVSITGDGKIVIENLVKQYELLFGRASIEVCKEAAKRVASKLDLETLPKILL